MADTFGKGSPTGGRPTASCFAFGGKRIAWQPLGQTRLIVAGWIGMNEWARMKPQTMLMPLRASLVNVPAWQVIIAVIFTLAAIYGLFRTGARTATPFCTPAHGCPYARPGAANRAAHSQHPAPRDERPRESGRAAGVTDRDETGDRSPQGCGPGLRHCPDRSLARSSPRCSQLPRPAGWAER